MDYKNIRTRFLKASHKKNKIDTAFHNKVPKYGIAAYVVIEKTVPIPERFLTTTIGDFGHGYKILDNIMQHKVVASLFLTGKIYSEHVNVSGARAQRPSDSTANNMNFDSVPLWHLKFEGFLCI